MYSSLVQDQQQLKALLTEATQLAEEFLSNLDKRPVAALSGSLPPIGHFAFTHQTSPPAGLGSAKYHCQKQPSYLEG